MRISDWSSDVCSSDLISQKCVLHVDFAGRLQMEDFPEQRLQTKSRLRRLQLAEMRKRDDESQGSEIPQHHRKQQAFRLSAHELAVAALGNRCHHQQARQDRKSVVWGTSVEVRVEHGGGVII